MSLLSDNYVGLQIPTVSGLKTGTTQVATNLLKGVGYPPAGFAFITRPDGTYLRRADGAYFVRPV